MEPNSPDGIVSDLDEERVLILIVAQNSMIALSRPIVFWQELHWYAQLIDRWMPVAVFLEYNASKICIKLLLKICYILRLLGTMHSVRGISLKNFWLPTLCLKISHMGWNLLFILITNSNSWLRQFYPQITTGAQEKFDGFGQIKLWYLK